MLSASFATISFHKNIGWTWNFYLRLVKRLKLPFFGTKGFFNKSICCYNVTTQRESTRRAVRQNPRICGSRHWLRINLSGTIGLKAFELRIEGSLELFACVQTGERKNFSDPFRTTREVGNTGFACEMNLSENWDTFSVDFLHQKEFGSSLERRKSLPSKGPGMSGVLLLEVPAQWKLIAANQMSRISAWHFIIFFYVERCFLQPFMMNSRFNLFVSCFSAISGLLFRVGARTIFLKDFLSGFWKNFFSGGVLA